MHVILIILCQKIIHFLFRDIIVILKFINKKLMNRRHYKIVNLYKNNFILQIIFNF